MRKGLLLTASLAFAGCVAAHAQTITPEDVARMRAEFGSDPSTTAIQNILTANGDIRSLALNHELDGKIDHYFKYRVNVSGITNQKQSGRCWMFTSMNVLRPSVMEQYNIDEFDFSHNYLYFWDILEKSNLFLENAIATASKPMDDREVMHYFSAPVDDGGVWNLYYNIAGKYGVVPASVMPETPHSENTAQMIALINEKLRTEGYQLRETANGTDGKKQAKALAEQKAEALNDIYRILALCLGEPPVEFEWRYRDCDGNIVSRTYTPMEFYAAITPEDYTPDNYIMIMNDPTREYYRLYEISNYRNTVEGINWVYSDDSKTFITTPEGVDSNATGYTSYGWAWPNQQITPVWEGDDADLWDQLQEFNNGGTLSPAFGFTWDSSSMANQITACNNVVSQYDAALRWGNLNPDETLEKFNADLEATGINEIIEEKQRQLDEYLASKE